MPLGGRKPTPDGVAKKNRNPTAEWIDVPDIPNENYPRLPEFRNETENTRQNRRFRKSTQRWYAAIARMPHTVLWREPEWEFAFATAEVLEAYADDPKKSAGYMTELRNREKIMGTTADYRRDLRIRYVSPDAENNEPEENYLDDDYGDLD